MVSRLVPSGMSSTTCSSDLLSNGSSFTGTARKANIDIDNRVASPMTIRKVQALRRERITGVATLR